MKSITIPDTVTSIGVCAFEGCNGLTSVIIGSGVTNIDTYVFGNCSNLETIIIPKSVTEIESGAFSNCSKLTTVYYCGSEEEWNEMYIGTNNDYLTNATIHYNSALVPTPKPTPTPAPTKIPLTTAEIERTDTDEDTEYSFDVDAADKYEDCYVYAAVYDENGVLIAVSRVPLETAGNTSVSVNKSASDAVVKVFVWADTLQSIIEKAAEIPLT